MADFDLELARQKGVSSPYAKGFMKAVERDGAFDVDFEATARMIAQDSALTTQANIGVPVQFVTFIDPQIMPILFAVLNATKIFSEAKKGDWADKSYIFPVEEFAGQVTPYSDFTENTASDVNYEYPERQNFLFETTLKYGELEEATAAKAKIQFASAKQRSAAYVIANAHNRFYLYGVEGKRSYGMLNDPNLNATITPNAIHVGDESSMETYTTWADKLEHAPDQFANLAFNDINKLFADLVSKNGGHIDANEKIVLAISNQRSALLRLPNKFGLTAMAMLKSNYPNLEIIELPQLSTNAGDMLYMVIPSLMGIDTAECAYSEKMRFGRVVPYLTSYRQKAIGGTWGCIIKRPSLIGRMLGI